MTYKPVPKKVKGDWILPTLDSPKAGSKRQYKRDVARECIVCNDELGTIEFPLADLSGKVLTQLMLLGLATYLHNSGSPRTIWLALKRGLVRSDRRLKVFVPVVPTTQRLSKTRQAIVETMLSYDGCLLTRQQAETVVRQMTPGEVQLWSKEPDVKASYRSLTGKSKYRLRDMVDRLQKAKA